MDRAAYEGGRRRRREPDGEGESYYVSMSDLMAGVLFLFIIMLTLFAVQLRTVPKRASPRPAALRATTPAAPVLALKPVQAPARAGPLSDAPWNTATAPPDPRAQALTILADYLHAHGVEAEVDYAAGAVRLANAALFDQGAGLSASGRQATTVLAQGLREVLPCYTVSAALPRAADCPATSQRIGAVFIEGHAEGRSDAWPVSVQQASSVFSALIAAEPRLTTLQGQPGSGQSVLSVSGYGPSRPVVPGDARRNNRLDVRLVMAAG